MSKPKSFDISKRVVFDAWLRVKANRGGCGVDEQSIRDVESDLEGLLYKLWNRLSSGCYFPPAVRAVDIPKRDGRVRRLGVPTVLDRVAQTAVRMYLEPSVERVFHQDSYGYRPGRSAVDAVGVCRERCFRSDWVIDLDIEAFFDSVDHELLLRAVKRHTGERWILLYIERWLKAPLELEDGTLVDRDRGTPQGSAISPLLANLFLHYAFDIWIQREFPSVQFERYCDDAVIHCKTKQQAELVLAGITRRLDDCGLKLHPGKTRVVYCKDQRRGGDHDHTQFDFLGYTFKARNVKTKAGGRFRGFNPAVSGSAAKAIKAEIRSWRLHRWTNATLKDLADFVNPKIRGWINYYGRFFCSELYRVLRHVNYYLMCWLQWKYKKLRGRVTRAWELLRKIADQDQQLFAHWKHIGGHG